MIMTHLGHPSARSETMLQGVGLFARKRREATRVWSSLKRMHAQAHGHIQNAGDLETSGCRLEWKFTKTVSLESLATPRDARQTGTESNDVFHDSSPLGMLQQSLLPANHHSSAGGHIMFVCVRAHFLSLSIVSEKVVAGTMDPGLVRRFASNIFQEELLV